MNLLKRFLGNYLNGHHGQNRSSHQNGYGNFHHKQKNHNNNYMSQNESQGVICTRCQSRNEPGARFCGQCGQAIQNTVCR
ncbi:TPA: zinc-ribbon domain-containing protein, partial [Legionella bozemanae]